MRHHLVLIKTVHTLAWAFFVGCIIGVPLSAAADRYDWALGFGIAVAIECVILAFNAMACPLTAVAARYTTDRRPNFDIYLPEWLARWNKHIFGPLFLLGALYGVARWRGWID
jgi:hypothetical protein